MFRDWGYIPKTRHRVIIPGEAEGGDDKNFPMTTNTALKERRCRRAGCGGCWMYGGGAGAGHRRCT